MRYYFDICTANMTTRDDEGTEFAGVNEAIDEAVRCARDLMAYGQIRGQSAIDWRFVIRDEIGSGVIFPFRNALRSAEGANREK